MSPREQAQLFTLLNRLVVATEYAAGALGQIAENTAPSETRQYPPPAPLIYPQGYAGATSGRMYPSSRRNQVDDVWNPYRKEWSSPRQLRLDDTYHQIDSDGICKVKVADSAMPADSDLQS